MKKLNLILFILLFTLLAIFSLHNLANPDIWWHLKTGEYILSGLKIPAKDIFSYTVPQHEWINLHWLFQITAFVFYKIAAVGGLIALKTVVLLAAFFILYKVSWRKKNEIISLFVFFLVIQVASERFLVRPEIFTFFFIASYLFILEKKKFVWLLPVLQVLWVNTEGLFIIGPFLIFCYLLEKNPDKKLIKIFILSIFACFLNPYTYKGVLFPFTLFTRIGIKSNIYKRVIDEFQAPFSGFMPTEHLIFFKGIVIISIISFWLNIKKVKIKYILIWLPFLYLALSARRNMALFSIVSAPVIMLNLNSFFDRLKPSDIRKKIITAFSLALVFIFSFSIYDVSTNRYWKRNKMSKRFGIKTSPFLPRRAVDFLIENNIKGRIFNSFTIGGYLIWKLFPEEKIFFDGRLEVYGDDFFYYYGSLIADKNLWKETMRKFNINCIFFLHSSVFLEDVLKRIKEDGNWELVYLDDISSIFLKNNAANRKILVKNRVDLNKIEPVPEKSEDSSHSHFARAVFFSSFGYKKKAEEEYASAIEKWPNFDIAYVNLGNIYNSRGDVEDAVLQYEKALKINPRLASAHYNLGVAYDKKGQEENAFKEYKKAVKLNPQDKSGHTNLGICYVRKGEIKKGIKEYGKALKADPDFPPALYNLGNAYYRQGQYDTAIPWYKKAIKIKADFFNAYTSLGLCFEKTGHPDKAILCHKEAIRINPRYVRAYNNLAICYVKKGLREEAKKEFERALGIDPGNNEILINYKRFIGGFTPPRDDI
ncbi:MAG: tetratricopeptide repeat protein [bacterium]